MNAVKTGEYIIKPEKYLRVVLNMFIRRYRAVILLILLAATVLSIYITDFIYALVVLIFGAFPFILFHIYFHYAGRYDNKYLFIEKEVSFSDQLLIIHPLGEDTISYITSQIKYGGYAKKNHLFILENKYMLNVPIDSFLDYDDYTHFENWLNTQILMRTLPQ